jgi:hypothetical protein
VVDVLRQPTQKLRDEAFNGLVELLPDDYANKLRHDFAPSYVQEWSEYKASAKKEAPRAPLEGRALRELELYKEELMGNREDAIRSKFDNRLLSARTEKDRLQVEYEMKVALSDLNSSEIPSSDVAKLIAKERELRGRTRNEDIKKNNPLIARD